MDPKTTNDWSELLHQTTNLRESNENTIVQNSWWHNLLITTTEKAMTLFQ